MSSDDLRRLLDGGPLELARPIFVIGSPRSGTPALATGLARHPALWTSHESYFLHDLFGSDRVAGSHRRHYNRKAPSWLKTQEVSRPELLGYLGLGVNALYTSRSGGRRWIDQTPLYTLMAEELGELFPTAQLLHIVRDGRKVVESMSSFLNKFEGRPEAVKYVPKWAYDFREACQTWTTWVDTAEAFRAAHPDRCLLVRNERLLAEPEVQCAEMFSFLEVDDDTAPAEYFRTTRTNSSFASKKHRGGAGGRGGGAGWGSWTREQREVFLEEAGPTMVRLGYALDGDLAERPGERDSGAAPTR